MTQSRAKIILIMNLVNKPGHTANWSEQKYVETIEGYLGKKVDFIVINNKEFSAMQQKHYEEDAGASIFLQDGYHDPRAIFADVLLDRVFTRDGNDSVKRSLIRHDPEKLAIEIGKIISK